MKSEALVEKSLQEIFEPVKTIAKTAGLVGISLVGEKLKSRKGVRGTTKERLVNDLAKILQQKLQQ